MKNPVSLISLLLCGLLIAFCSFIYYPKFKAPAAEATIGWDVSGYYMYLPAFFIYQDLAQVEFQEEIMEKYAPTPSFEQAYKYENGNYIMKYSMGQAVMFSPFFLLAHGFASLSSYPADGFSLPYQFGIFLGSFLIALLGLWLARKILLLYFKDKVVGIALLLMVFGSNYLEYATMSAAMTHNYLFTVYAGLIWLTIRFYEDPSFLRAAGIGLLVGLAALTRPTEILVGILPLLWGLSTPMGKFLQERFSFVLKHFPKFLLAGFLAFCVGFLQLLYWKSIGGHWLIYSYQDQGFSWLSPHVMDCLFSYKAGWLVYSPIMIFSLLGFIPLARQYKKLFFVGLIFSVLFMYVTFAWDIWWYGGSLGQRALVQAYPILLFPMAAFIQWVLSRKSPIFAYVFYALGAVMTYHNLWITHQAHKGGLFIPEQMNRTYFQHILWKSKDSVHPEARIYLDNQDAFLGEPKNPERIGFTDFEGDSVLANSPYTPIEGKYSTWVDGNKDFSLEWEVPLSPTDKKYLRLSADVFCQSRSGHYWSFPQLILDLRNGEKTVRKRIIRPFRHIDQGKATRINLDLKLPNRDYDRVKIYMWNGGGNQPMLMDRAELLVFDE